MKFMLTKELGRITRWLRLLGYDASFFDSDDMKRLFIKAFNEDRIVITKRQNLSNIKSLKLIYIKGDLLEEQIVELKKRIRLEDRFLFTRCADCNKKVVKVHKNSIKDLVPDYVFKTQKDFFQCPLCKRIFWKGTHWTRAGRFINEICS